MGSIMPVIIDYKKGKEVAEHLYNRFSSSGIEMPEDIILKDIQRGSLEHLLYITLTVSIDYTRDASLLWENSRKTFEDKETKYLFNPKSTAETKLDKIIEDMHKHKLSKKPAQDAYIWQTISKTFYEKWNGDPLKFLENCNWDSCVILERLRNDIHTNDGKSKSDYPYLRGKKIGALWLRMLRDNVGITQLKNLDKVCIPVDIHVARATLTTGIVRGQFKGRLTELYEHIRNAWHDSVKGLNIKSRDMIALDVDEPLWILSKNGCAKRDKATGNCPKYDDCVARDFCIQDKVKIEKGIVELDT